MVHTTMRFIRISTKSLKRAKYKYGNRNFWAKGYYVSTVGLNTKVVEEYIRNQEKEDMIQDNLSKKEYVDFLKGKP